VSTTTCIGNCIPTLASMHLFRALPLTSITVRCPWPKCLVLEAALRGPKRKSLASVLASMPNVGNNKDFARQQSDSRKGPCIWSTPT
jgi:hypothetical protein